MIKRKRKTLARARIGMKVNLNLRSLPGRQIALSNKRHQDKRTQRIKK